MRTIIETTEDDAGAIAPAHPVDGERYEHSLLYGERTIAFADSLGELIDLILPGYAALPDDPSGDDAALIARHDHIAQVANAIQGGFNEQASERGLLDMATADENLTTALGHDRSLPWSGMVDGAGESSYVWQSDIPLVLLTTDYAPFTDRPSPQGEAIVMLDPSDEATYLASLTKLGLVQYMRRA